MSRPTRPNSLLKEDIPPINEIFDSVIQTKYKVIDHSQYIMFQFETNSGKSYDLEFHDTYEYLNTKLDSGKKLGDYFPNDFSDVIMALDIAFTYSEVSDKENPDQYEKDLNRNEQTELFARISYILKKELPKIKNIELFVVGGARRNRNNIYYNLFKNHFSNEFYLDYGISVNHPNTKSMFLIKK